MGELDIENVEEKLKQLEANNVKHVAAFNEMAKVLNTMDAHPAVNLTERLPNLERTVADIKMKIEQQQDEINLFLATIDVSVVN